MPAGIVRLPACHNLSGIGKPSAAIHLQRGNGFWILFTGTVRGEINNLLQIPSNRIDQADILFQFPYLPVRPTETVQTNNRFLPMILPAQAASRKLTLVPIIQSLAQLEKNYGKEGSEIIQDNVQDTIFGGFAPNSQTAEVLSKALGSRTVMSGSVSKGGGKDSASRSLQMMERPLMTPDELKSIPKGQFVVMKTGTHPMQTRLRLFLDWGISFGDPYLLPERAARTVAYANKQELEQAIFRCHHAQPAESDTPPAPPVPPKTPTARGGASYAQARRTRREPPPPVVVRTDGGQE